MKLLGLGSNMGDRWVYLRRALHYLRQLPQCKIDKISPVYESNALLKEAAPKDWDKPFLNLVEECVLANRAAYDAQNRQPCLLAASAEFCPLDVVYHLVRTNLGDLVPLLNRVQELPETGKLRRVRQCSYCQTYSAELKRCPCQENWYCGKTCQTSDWDEHERMHNILMNLGSNRRRLR